MTGITPYLLILLMLALSACFSGTEMAFSACNKMRVKKKAEDTGKSSAKLGLSISEKFTNSLSALLIGNNITNTVAYAVATLIVVNILKSRGMSEAQSAAVGSVVATIVITIIMLIFAEIVPKVIAKNHADALVVLLAYPLRIFTIILSPAVLVVTLFVKLLRVIWGKDEPEDEPTVTEEELSSIIETVEEEGVIDEEKSDLLQSALDFSDITVQEILTPRIDMTSIDINDDREKVLEIISESRYSRIPVYEDSIDNIIGILYLNHFYKKYVDDENFDLRPILIKPFFLHKTVKLPAALAKMKDNKNHIAIVIDEFGGTLGIVTMEDILEEIVGDIWDESDEIEPDYIKTGENTYDVSGDMNIGDFFELLDIDDDDFESEYTTVGGWAIEMLDGLPSEGDNFNYKNIYVVVTKMDDMRITNLSVIVGEENDSDDSSSAAK